MKASILLPVYNGAETLRETIDSLLSQDTSDFELLISNDNSKDDSQKIIEEYAAKDRRIRPYHFNPGKGLAASLNFLMKEAKSEYLMRIDQDDICLPSRLRTQAEFLDHHPDVAVVGSTIFHMGKTIEQDHLMNLPETHEQIKETLKSYNCLYHPATMLRKSMVLKAGGYRTEFKNAEDYDLWLRLSDQHSLYNLQIPLLRYRFSTGGMTLSRKWEQLYFVNLAQVAHEFPNESMESLKERARIKHEAMGKSYFLNIVYTGTIEELLRLGFKSQAWIIVRKMIQEVGLKKGLDQAFKIVFKTA